MDLYLKFSSKTEADSVLYTKVETAGKKDVEYTQYLVEGAATEDGEVEHGWVDTLAEGDVVLDTKVGTTTVKDTDTTVITLEPKFANIDVVGTIYKTVAEGEEPVAYDGYHVNVRLVGSEDASTLTPFSVVPSVPRRTWA